MRINTDVHVRYEIFNELLTLVSTVLADTNVHW